MPSMKKSSPKKKKTTADYAREITKSIMSQGAKGAVTDKELEAMRKAKVNTSAVKKKPSAAEAMKAGVKKTYEETAKKVPPLGKESMKKKKVK